MSVYDELKSLVSEALEQYDAGMAVDLERRMTELAAQLDERALADEAATLFDRIIEAADDDGNVEAVEATEIVGWLARYREARGR
jgi:uncharacterized membrane protein YebE (DUF533 family)